MSLLMQALKKAERARQSGLQEEDVPDGAYDMPEALPDNGTAAARAPVMHDPAPARGTPLELSLEPLDERPAPEAPPVVQAPPVMQAPPIAQARPEPAARNEPPPPIQPAVEATHNPVPPQARHEGARPHAGAGEIPVADARAAPRPASAAAGERRGPGAPERRAVPRTPSVQADKASGIDLGRLRVAGLGSLLVIVAGTFAYLYWQGISGPGPGASLPMVPMPPPSATGATGAADGGIVVTPAGPPFGPLGTAEPAAPPQAAVAAVAAVAPVIAAPPAAAATSPGPATAAAPAAPRRQRGQSSTGPTAAQLAAIEDPEVRAEAMRIAAEQADRALRNQQSTATPPDAGAPGAEAASATPATPSAPAALAAPSAGGSDVHVARGAASPGISPAVQAGYAALASGDLAGARQRYAAALRDDPNNRDALLGSAAVALRERRDDDAAAYYARLLALNPNDAEAVSALTALRPGAGDRAEVRLKGALRGNPDAAPVHFALGNLYARQGRWQEAQAAYFRAWTAAPANADYAFNLAVGLDRLNQGRLARDYYGRALALSADGAAAFDRAAAQRRLQELGGMAAAPQAPAGSASTSPLAAPSAVPVPPAIPAQAGN